MKYVIISPVRDEEKYIEGTIKSVVHQTVLPAEWVMVDDGSKDRTYDIIKQYSNNHIWINTVRRPDRGYRNSAGGEIDAFYDGYSQLRVSDWDFIVKLDGDLLLDNTYFENCFKELIKNPRLGIAGGTIHSNVNGKYVREDCPTFHVRGATKIYRKDCWEAIGGLVRRPGWDTLDEIKANMLGWETRSFPEISLRQDRATGGPEGPWRDSVKNGLANYIAGYHPLFMLIKCFKRIFHQRGLMGSAGLLYGFLGGYINHIEQIEDQNLVRYIRIQQINRLLLRKSIWKY